MVHKAGERLCPNCERCDLTLGIFCHDCGYDERLLCPKCSKILTPFQVAILPHVFECKDCSEKFPQDKIEPKKLMPSTVGKAAFLFLV